ncbi:sigma 54-interacting transcriptional regulator [Intestinimonas sp. UBA1698]|uniref:sigma 54-interacting transcriptional regulator n=1 Tax=Intestinimonas sp. UBA1698 TaxID=1946651 RepID=UPI00257AB77F|nr:sigma 54-interacting transcriptional regulator [Intestinimonas sp. UBA1698]
MNEEALDLTVGVDGIKDGYRAILDTIFCSILVFDGRGQLIHCNCAARNFFHGLGIDPERAYFTRFEAFSEPMAERVDLISGKGRYIIELEGRQVVCNVHPWVIDGVRRGTIFILHESMHSNCIMQELDVTNSLLQEINIFVESSHDGILVTDSQGVVIRVNAAFERAFSVLRREVIGRNVTELIAEGLYLDSAALKVLETRETATVVLEQKGKRLIATGTPAFDICGSFTSVVVNIRDITELNDLQSRLEHQRMVAEGYIRELTFIQSQNAPGADFVVHSKEMQHIMDTIKTISQVDSTLLITGESGTGKEVIVNQVHRSSNRRDKPIIKINCGAIPASLFESELFGYEDGAFTGARRRGKAGFFELANEGTLFLDEIGELDLDLQVKLLRVIQEGEVTRIGGTKTLHVDVRIIAATNRDLWQQVQEGKFRQDLYYRLNVINIEVPPLRERRDDVIPLAVHFIEKYNQKYSKHKELSMELGKILRSLDWLGNIRELENLIENMVVLVQRDVLYPEDLPPRYRQSGAEVSPCQVTVHGIMPLKEAIQQVESQLLCHAQEKYTTTREIAKVLGVDQSTVSRKMGTLLHR